VVRSRSITSFALAAVAAMSAAVLVSCSQTALPPPPADAPYLNPALSASVRAQDLLGRMTPEEKYGQMMLMERLYVEPQEITSLGVGSIMPAIGYYPTPNVASKWQDTYDELQQRALATRLRIPLFFGTDEVHGQDGVTGSTIFPHNIGLGAANDANLMQQIGRATAQESAGTGINWAYAPAVSVARDDRWGRTFESFGEVPSLPTALGPALVTGLQGTGVGKASPSVMATAKHFIADGGTLDGHDRGDAQISETELRAIHLPPFQAAVNANVGAVMVSYSSWNGVKDHANHFLLTDLLKSELGFKGIVMSDFTGIDQIDGQYFFSPAEVATAVNAGIDLVAGPISAPLFVEYMRQDVANGSITMDRVDDAVLRIITKKFELGLFEQPFADRSMTSSVGSAAHRQLARQAVRESQVLLKNANNVLPLSKSSKVFVAGKSADNIGYQSGGWTIGWQGDSGPITQGTTILQGIQQAVTSPANVTYDRYGNGVNNSYSAAIAVIGETPYAEFWGDRQGQLGNLQLDAEDQGTLAKLESAGIPVIVVMVSGRPLEVTDQIPKWNAFVEAWLPGTEGNGVSDVLFGDFKPTGKLPVTWFARETQEPINVGDGKVGLFPFGFGLTYP
jgi:beta-glucosidase